MPRTHSPPHTHKPTHTHFFSFFHSLIYLAAPKSRLQFFLLLPIKFETRFDSHFVWFARQKEIEDEGKVVAEKKEEAAARELGRERGLHKLASA